MKLKPLTDEECDNLGAEWLSDRHLIRSAYAAGIKAERERCCAIIHGMCESDNVAQRTVDKILSDE